MSYVNVTELRNHLAPIDKKKDAQKKLIELRKNCKIGDVISPIDEEWDAEK